MLGSPPVSVPPSTARHYLYTLNGRRCPATPVSPHPSRLWGFGRLLRPTRRGVEIIWRGISAASPPPVRFRPPSSLFRSPLRAIHQMLKVGVTGLDQGSLGVSKASFATSSRLGPNWSPIASSREACRGRTP